MEEVVARRSAVFKFLRFQAVDNIQYMIALIV